MSRPQLRVPLDGADNGIADDARDAARWRALLSAARMRVLGTNHPPYSHPVEGSRYLAIELWTKSFTPNSMFGRQALIEFTDAILRSEQENKE